MPSKYQIEQQKPKWKIIPTKVRVINVKKSSESRNVYVWRNVNLITAPKIEIERFYNKGNNRYEERRKVVWVPDTSYIKTTRDLPKGLW